MQFNLITGALTPAFKSGVVGPFKVGTDLYFAAMAQWNDDGAGLPGGNPSSMGMFKSTDGGLTWAEMDSLNRPVMAAVNNLGVALGPDDGHDYVAESRFFTGCLNTAKTQFFAVYLGPLTGAYTTNISVSVFTFATDSWGAADTSGPAIDLQALAGNIIYLGRVSGQCLLVAGVGGSGALSIGFTCTTYIDYDVPVESQLLTVSTYMVRWNGAWSGETVLPGIDLTTPRTPGYVRSTWWVGVGVTANGQVVGLLRDMRVTGVDPGTYSHCAYYLLDDGVGGVGASIDVAGNPADNNAFSGEDNWTSPVAVVGNLVFFNGFLGGEFALAMGDFTGAPVWTIFPRSGMPAPLGPPDNEYSPLDIVGDSVGGQMVVAIASSITGGVAYAGFNGIAWTALTLIAPFADFPPGAGSFDRIWPGSVNLTTGIALGSTNYAWGFGSPFVPPTTVPASVTPGGWSVWPPVFRIPNWYDKCLEAFKCKVQRHPFQDASRCVDMVELWDGSRAPTGMIEFWKPGRIVTPAPGSDYLVAEFTVPTGFAGMLYGIHLGYTGTGFVEGSGDILWRVMIGNAWAAKGLGQVTTQLGTPYQCLQLTDYIKVKSNQTIRVLVNVPNLSGLIQVGASKILSTLQGWYFPQ